MMRLVGIALLAVATPALAQHDHRSHAGASQQDPADSHAGHRMDGAEGDPHAGHAMPPAAPMEAHQAHAGHEPGIPDPPVRGPSAAAMGGPDHAADAIFGAAAMAPAREIVRREHGDIKSHNILIDQLEAS